MFLFVLGAIDLFGSIMLFLSLARFSAAPDFVFALGALLVLKGIYSILVQSYFAGITDSASGFIIILMAFQIFLPDYIAIVFGFLMLVKSLQSLVFFVFSR